MIWTKNYFTLGKYHLAFRKFNLVSDKFKSRSRKIKLLQRGINQRFVGISLRFLLRTASDALYSPELDNMINRTNAVQILHQNLQRTESLIEAMDKIQAYNRIYQMKTAEVNADFAAVVTRVQNEQLATIEQSCAEHAIISLATAFETYYKELLQQLLFEFPEFFASKQTKFSDQIEALIKEKQRHDYEEIEKRLKLHNRFAYYQLFSAYSVQLLTPQDMEFLEYVYAKRNSLVHDAGKVTKKTQAKLGKIRVPLNVDSLKTESKSLRTKFKKIMMQVDQRIAKTIGGRAGKV